ncbi:2-polyprenyl-6-methoxyphenol hydroxylase-like FAD-dependent oxidoreductase [Kineococcus xinjiangensis]|uniref:2-polyprenyl-6-methoxyphenol hydroxylase-like FAD-dependent oxidoreductase n=1 Tax=Kineococcus xinjiangensis TaxID=512762 RepID=A0A2S6IX35_9ACTN|nr:FAD-dependent monooxygenase [Kineococcus xinjiangensis]PPK98846.1 2-polyprenyl-6-methoxyphenol hydroxylase-like FAD-dependent oxidoreductase [Kineococcus xinjiangensis]
MPAVRNVLVLGGGAAGAATAILLARAGVSVELAEARPAPPEVGSGITLQGNALRILRDLGVWPQVEAAGYSFDSLGIRLPDPVGTLVAELPDVRSGGPDLPATVGMHRPVLTRILLDRAAEVGVRLRFGTTAVALRQGGEVDGEGVEVDFADGPTGRYDLVVGADGIRSWTRRAIGIDVEPRATGMGIWRVYAPRPAEITRTDLVYGGPCYIAGYCPTSEDSLYAYLVEDAQDRFVMSQAEKIATFRQLAAAYHGPWDALREGISDDTHINYTWFETHVVEGPWHRGRVVLVGDAVHSCPPTIAQGAAQALEDAAVLAELLLTADRLDEDLLERYNARRQDRARQVVDASVQIGRWMLEHTPREEADVAGLIGRICKLVTDPA